MYRDQGILALWLLPLATGCSSFDLKASEDGAYRDTGSWDGDEGGGGGAAPDADTGDDGLGSEEENDFLSLRPATTRKYVFVVNTERDTVSRISVPGLEVVTAPVGVRPSAVQTASDYRRAVTFNSGSDDLSVIDAETMEVSTVPVQPNLNALALSPDGNWAVVYHNVLAEDAADDPPQGAISYNELSLVNLETLEHFEVVVGTFPHDVVFDEEATKAIVISDDYMAVIDLTASEPSPLRIALSEETLDPPVAEEVLLLPSGEYAFVRQYGATELVLVDLLAGTTDLLAVGNNPTDMDLSPSGEEAIVVARGAKELWIYSALDPRATASVVAMPADDVFGSVLMSPDNTKGLLYSTQSGQARYGVWFRDTNEVKTYPLEKPVASVGVSPRGNTALVFHTLSNGDIDEDSPFYNENALTLVDLGSSTLFANPIKLSGAPTAYANAADGETGYFIMEGLPYLGTLDYAGLSHDIQVLPSEPVHLGVLPEEDTAFVNQNHPLGRLSFYDPNIDPSEQSALQTITGFELNAAIEQ